MPHVNHDAVYLRSHKPSAALDQVSQAKQYIETPQKGKLHCGNKWVETGPPLGTVQVFGGLNKCRANEYTTSCICVVLLVQ